MRSTISSLTLSSRPTLLRLIMCTVALLFSSAAALAQTDGNFFGFTFGTPKSDIAKKYTLTPSSSSKFRNAYDLSGDPPVIISEIPALGYIVHLYFSDNDQLIRVLVEIGTREGGEVEALDAEHTTMLWEALRTRLQKRYSYISDTPVGRLLADNVVTMKVLEKSCKRFENDNVIMISVLGPFINNDDPTDASKYHYAFCVGKDVFSYFDAPKIPAEIIVGFQPDTLAGAFVTIESCSRKFGISGCSDFGSKYTKPKSQPF